MIESTIDYIEIGIFDGSVETTGLLTRYGMKSDKIRLMTSSDSQNELFDMSFYTITRIVIGKSSDSYDTLEQYIFKKTDDDQDTAKTVIINNLKNLEAEGRTSASGFLLKNTFKNVPEQYTKKSESISAATIIENQRASTVGGAGSAASKSSDTTDTGKKTVYNNYNNNYHLRNVKKVESFPRSSDLPTKAALKSMRLAVKAVTEGTFEQHLPDMEGDDALDPPSQADIDDAMQDVDGNDRRSLYAGYDY